MPKINIPGPILDKIHDLTTECMIAGIDPRTLVIALAEDWDNAHADARRVTKEAFSKLLATRYT